jgi:transcriptional regulator with XRE-family HTH domain
MQDRRAQDRVDPALWHRTDMRAALAARDIAGVFRLLQRVGVSQRRIAALTGQSQSEISEILAGRQVVSYEVLTRIADGLGAGRGQLGLAYDDVTAQLVGDATPADDDDESRRLMSRLAELTMGGAPADPKVWEQPVAPAWTLPPDQIGPGDVARLEVITAQLRVMDHQLGGGACRDAVLAQLGWAQQLLRAHASDDTERTLHIAMAELHLLAGWTSFDIGLTGPARRHYARALEHARFIDETSLVAKVLYCIGRLNLHHGWGPQAVRIFQVGLVTAQQSGYGRAVAMMHANLAWAHALVGDTEQVVDGIGRARDEYARAEGVEVPRWLAFFDSAELQALRGTALAAQARMTQQQRTEAIERFTLSTALRELPQARPRAFELTALAWLLIDDGSFELGIRTGHEAVDLAENLRSQRVVDRFAPLRDRLARRLSDTDARDLVERIRDLRPIEQVSVATAP